MIEGRFGCKMINRNRILRIDADANCCGKLPQSTSDGGVGNDEDISTIVDKLDKLCSTNLFEIFG